MDRIVDAIIVLVLCVPLVIAQCTAEAAVAYMLAAVIAGCAAVLAESKAMRNAVAVLLAAGCALLPGMYALIPFAAYMCMCQRPWAVRLIWLVPLVLAFANVDWHASVYITVLASIASALAVRTVRGEAERKGMRAVRDGLREQAIDLGKVNRLLEEELVVACAHAEGAADATAMREDGLPAISSFNAAAFADLTDREQAVVELIAEGCDNREIAGSLYLSEGTVRNHISAILQKKQLKNRTQIAIMYYGGRTSGSLDAIS